MFIKVIGTYFAMINIIACIVNIVDKSRAKRHKWRIKEHTLWIIAMLGGAPMTYITMQIIRHKTKHTDFMIGMPLLAIADIGAIIYLCITMGG